MKVLWAALFYLHFVFWQKNISAKAAGKMLMKF
jgi:hypothetical protein